MKVLIATKETQKQRKNDFCFCEEREFVKFGMECDGEEIDGGCGCRRSMVGFKTLKGTTTFKVEKIDISKEEYIKQLKKSDIKAGWYKLYDNPAKEIKEEADELLNLAQSFNIGDILEKRGNELKMR